MVRKIFSLFVALFFLCSCYTINFKRDSSSTDEFYQFSQWHHIGLLGLVEFSAPVNLKEICSEDSWESVRVRTGFLQGLISKLQGVASSYVIPSGKGIQISGETNVPMPGVIFFSGVLYSPEEVSVACRE